MSKVVPSLVVGSDDEPIVLTGPPRALTGRIHLHNPSGAKVVLRDAGLRDPSGVLRLPQARHILQPLVIRPDQASSVALSIAVDPGTPPGEYQAELDVGGRTRTVVLQVAEVVDLSVQPRTLVIVNRPGVAQTKRLVVTNEGNVGLTVGDPAEVDLRRDPPSERVVRVAIEEFLRTEIGDKRDLEDLAAALFAVAREEERLGSVDVRAKKPVEIAPGETTTVELALTLRDEIPVTRRYRGRLPVITRDVVVVVVASPGMAQPEPRAPRPRKRASATRKTSPKRGAKR